MWFVVCSSIDCLPTDLLIDGKFSNQHNQTSIIERSPSDFSADTANSTPKIVDPKEVHDSQLKVHKRVKRVHIFRPLFVYRQERIERQRILENRKLQNRRVNHVIERKNECCKHCKCCNACWFIRIWMLHSFPLENVGHYSMSDVKRVNGKITENYQKIHFIMVWFCSFKDPLCKSQTIHYFYTRNFKIKSICVENKTSNL